MESSPDIVKEDWQTTKSSLTERNTFMFKNSLLSDINFLVGDDEETTVNFPAHKYVLAISSPVFFAMFNGELAEQENTIRIPDSNPEEFEEFLRYIYTDQFHLEESLAPGVIYLAHKYMNPDLTQKCWDFLIEELSPTTVVSTIILAEKYDNNELIKKCWEIIVKNTREVIDDFTKAPYEIVEELYNKDCLKASELELFQTLDRWAGKQCEKKGEEASGKTKRSVVSDLIYKIYYPGISLSDFVRYVLKSELFEASELSFITDLFFETSHSEILQTSSRYRVTPRSNTVSRFSLFTSNTALSFIVSMVKKVQSANKLWFTVNKPAKITGIAIYGDRFQTTQQYSVNLQLVEHGVDELEVKRTHLSEYNTSTSYPICEILFNKAQWVDSGVLSLIKADIIGPSSIKGCEGEKSIFCDGVDFKLYNISSSYEQISEILFQIC